MSDTFSEAQVEDVMRAHNASREEAIKALRAYSDRITGALNKSYDEILQELFGTDTQEK